MILTFFKGLLREFWLLVKDPRGIFMFLVAPLLMNIVVWCLPKRHCQPHSSGGGGNVLLRKNKRVDSRL